MTKSEIYLASMLGEYSGTLPPPNTKIEIYLHQLATSGGAGPGSAGGGVLQNSLTSGDAKVGGIDAGTTYPAGTSMEKMWADLLDAQGGLVVTIGLTPSKDMYSANIESISTIDISAIVLNSTATVDRVQFYANSTLIHEISSDLGSGGKFTYTYTPPTPIVTTTTFRVVVSSGNIIESSEKTVKFLGQSYYGTVDDSVVTPTELDILGLQNTVLKDTNGLIYDGISVEYGKVLYAYPTVLGKIDRIVDALNFDYTNSYTNGEITVNGIPYLYYLLKDSMGTENGYQKFE